MRNIEIKILNPDVIEESVKMMAMAARITQRGHTIGNMDDLLALYDKPASPALINAMAKLPHPTLQKFGVINVAVVGASRRFLAQITRHQNEVKFMSASLQYSDYSGKARFVTPYALIEDPAEDEFLRMCEGSMEKYQSIIKSGVDNDSAGYVAPQALRNILLISATPFQWKHMIHQRTCRRNTDETRYVMLLIWEQLYKLCPEVFGPETTGPFCQQDNGKCKEGKMTCCRPLTANMTPAEILDEDFPKIRG